ncbi:hypothetical protein K8942_04610 [Candidatus Peribacteria bacterium]|nr:MAG: hypothetical protein K8942_04610 [Candidatus Peribacteria bacterium]
METMMTTRQVVDAIHEGLPLAKKSEEAGTPLGKTEVADGFSFMMAPVNAAQNHWAYRLRQEEIDTMHRAMQQATSIRSLIADIRIAMKPSFDTALVYFLEVLEEETAKIPILNEQYPHFKMQHWLRQNKTKPYAAEGIRKKYPDASEEELAKQSLTETMVGGIQNYSFNSLASIFTAPKLFEEQYDAVIEPTDWRLASESSLPMLKHIASSESDVFIDGISWAMLTGEVTRPEKIPDSEPAFSEDNFDWPAYDPWAFRLNGNMEMHLHERIIEPTRERLLGLIASGDSKVTGERTGCPVRLAFPFVHKRIMLAAEKVIFPYAEKILSLPSE